MTYFNYHAKIKKLINEGDIIGYKFFDDYNGIHPALVLYFSSCKPMPVREYKFDEYMALISSLKIKEIK